MTKGAGLGNRKRQITQVGLWPEFFTISLVFKGYLYTILFCPFLLILFFLLHSATILLQSNVLSISCNQRF